MVYIISRQRVSINDGRLFNNARRRIVKSIVAEDSEEAVKVFMEEIQNIDQNNLFRFELTDAKWSHIKYWQNGELI